jgi:transposase-like protein
LRFSGISSIDQRANRTAGFSLEVIERAVRMVFVAENLHLSQRAASESTAGKVGRTAATLRRWLRQTGRAQGPR